VLAEWDKITVIRPAQRHCGLQDMRSDLQYIFNIAWLFSQMSCRGV